MIRIIVAAAFFACVLAAAAPARAIPLFAERYHLRCAACHSVIPELNPAGNSFREHGYRFPPSVPRHGTVGVALRYQMEYEKDPAEGNRRWTPGGVLLSNFDAGAISTFLHYNLGAGGGPSGVYLMYAATYNEHTNSLYRVGQFEVPLPHSPGQRLDDLQPYGYEATKVGLNDLLFTQPRQGIDAERNVGNARVVATASIGEFHGAAYGGRPIPTGETTYASQPELGLCYNQRIASGLSVGGEELDGVRNITLTGRTAFTDSYRRSWLYASYEGDRFDVL
ncbi:MAG: hypothetical protein JOY59_11700, partial [Candidatus Eremiobacteraeota bacterium]|nr:hypothetical protein [Candidatus Eremiobacteraeota bacterium]